MFFLQAINHFRSLFVFFRKVSGKTLNFYNDDDKDFAEAAAKSEKLPVAFFFE